jgi:cytochrome c556
MTISAPRRAVPGIALALALAACGGSAGHPAAPTTRQGAATQAATAQACRQIGAVLADGPDPDADPAGYAEAQILPLRQVPIADSSLKTAVGQLDRAYQRLFSSAGKSRAAAQAVAAASKQVNAICPGAAS